MSTPCSCCGEREAVVRLHRWHPLRCLECIEDDPELPPAGQYLPTLSGQRALVGASQLFDEGVPG